MSRNEKITRYFYKRSCYLFGDSQQARYICTQTNRQTKQRQTSMETKDFLTADEIIDITSDEEEQYSLTDWTIKTTAWLFNAYCHHRAPEWHKFLEWTVRDFLKGKERGSLKAYCEYVANRFGTTEENARIAIKEEEFFNKHIAVGTVFGLDILEYTRPNREKQA